MPVAAVIEIPHSPKLQPGLGIALRVEIHQLEPVWDELSLAGLDEEELRKMDPDDRVAVLEQAKLDPYDYIYLAC